MIWLTFSTHSPCLSDVNDDLVFYTVKLESNAFLNPVKGLLSNTLWCFDDWKCEGNQTHRIHLCIHLQTTRKSKNTTTKIHNLLTLFPCVLKGHHESQGSHRLLVIGIKVFSRIFKVNNNIFQVYILRNSRIYVTLK